MERYHAAEQAHAKKQRIIYDGHQVKEEESEDPDEEEEQQEANEGENEDEEELVADVDDNEQATTEKQVTDEEEKEERRSWLDLMELTFDDISEVITDKTRDFVALQQLRKRPNAMEHLVDTIKQSDTYLAINDENAALSNRGYDEQEADMMAWYSRRFMIIPYLKTIIVQHQEQEEGEGEEEKEDDFDMN
jgi:hypothetical protein